MYKSQIQKGLMNKLQSIKKEKNEVGFSSDEYKRIRQIDYLVDNLFYNDLGSIPKKLIPLNPKQTFEHNQERMF